MPRKRNNPVPPEYVSKLVREFCRSEELAQLITKMVERELDRSIDKAGIELRGDGQLVVFDWTDHIIFEASLEKLVKEQFKEGKPGKEWREMPTLLRKLADWTERELGK